MPRSFVSRYSVVAALVAAAASVGSTASADDVAAPAPPPEAAPAAAPVPAPPPETAPASPPPPAPAPAPYSLPWQLRPAAATTVVRSDTAFAKYENAASNGGFTEATSLLVSYKIPGTGEKWQGLAPLVRVMLVNDAPPSAPGKYVPGSYAIVNPLVGATYAIDLGSSVRASFFLGATIPIGMGGGDTPDLGVLDARQKGLAARSQMDNSLFAVDDLAVIPGADIAWVSGGLTLQAEATLFQLWRVSGSTPGTPGFQKEASKTNFTSGVHAGYFFCPELSVGLDVRYQRWINAPLTVDADKTGTLVDNWTAALGPRFHFPLGGSVKIHPGIAYARGFDKPMALATPNYHIVQLDIPVTF